MEFKIVNQEAFKVVGKALRVSVKDGENLKRIPKFWSDCHEDGTLATLSDLTKTSSHFKDSKLGVVADPSPDWQQFTYLIAVEANVDSIPAGFMELTVRSSDWAVFDVQGQMPEAIQAVWNSIFSDFFSNEKYVHASGPEIEVYPPGERTGPDYKSAIWIPVVAKRS